METYLFSWENVSGNDNERLLKFLIDDLNIDWSENADIHKSDDNLSILISKDANTVTIRMDEHKEKATLEICDIPIYDLKVKKENNKLRIYVETNYIVYRDKEYTTSWISHELADEIANYLLKKGFCVFGANKLGKWMKEVIRSEDTKNTVVVFAQDVAPDTVFGDIGTKPDIDNMGATVLIRQYLDFCGRVVWIGDMPFSYQGKDGAKNPEELKDLSKKDNSDRTYLKRASTNVLSVIPIFLYAPRRPVEITERGREWGLGTVWSSLRPIVIDKKTMELTKYLAKTEGLMAGFPIKYKKRGLLNWLKRNVRRIKSVSISVAELGIGAEADENKKENPEPECYEEYASAWFKNFNKKEPNSGFVRIWDFSPSVITKTMKEELYHVAKHIINIKKASTGARLISFIIDSIIVGLLGLVFSYVLCAAFGDVCIALLLGLLLIPLLYFTCLFRRGQTVGMYLVSIKLFRIDGTDEIGFKSGFFRGLGMIISGLVICLGYLWILIDENKQGWHDKIAGTSVKVIEK
jgi:uncharacterized RDD family membrane protein YckC